MRNVGMHLRRAVQHNARRSLASSHACDRWDAAKRAALLRGFRRRLQQHADVGKVARAGLQAASQLSADGGEQGSDEDESVRWAGKSSAKSEKE